MISPLLAADPYRFEWAGDPATQTTGSVKSRMTRSIGITAELASKGGE